MKKLMSLKKNNFSTALMIDQESPKELNRNFFKEKAFTTTIPVSYQKNSIYQ